MYIDRPNKRIIGIESWSEAYRKGKWYKSTQDNVNPYASFLFNTTATYYQRDLAHISAQINVENMDKKKWGDTHWKRTGWKVGEKGMCQAKGERCNIKYWTLLTIDVDTCCHRNGEEHGKGRGRKCDKKIKPSVAPFWGCRYSLASINTLAISRCASPTLLAHTLLPSHIYSLKIVAVGSCRTSLLVRHGAIYTIACVL